MLNSPQRTTSRRSTWISKHVTRKTIEKFHDGFSRDAQVVAQKHTGTTTVGIDQNKLRTFVTAAKNLRERVAVTFSTSLFRFGSGFLAFCVYQHKKYGSFSNRPVHNRPLEIDHVYVRPVHNSPFHDRPRS